MSLKLLNQYEAELSRNIRTLKDLVKNNERSSGPFIKAGINNDLKEYKEA